MAHSGSLLAGGAAFTLAARANTPRSPSAPHRRAMASRRGAALLAAALVALGATVGGAEAAPYQKWVLSDCPGASSSCQIVMEPAVPANKRVQVTSVSCFILIAQNAQIQAALLGQPGGISDYFVPIRTDNSDAARFAYNGQTVVFAYPGDNLRIVVAATKDMLALRCKIAGTIVNL